MKYLLALLLLVGSAHAEVVGMVGLGKQALEKQPFERAASLGYRIHLCDSWFVKPEIGGWLGGRGKASWFVGMPIGVQVWIPHTGAYATAAVGPSRISQPDEVLGGRGQFDTEVCVGLKTKAANIDSCLKHLSSAGLAMPNLGRDFLMLQVGVEL